MLRGGQFVDPLRAKLVAGFFLPPVFSLSLIPPGNGAPRTDGRRKGRIRRMAKGAGKWKWQYRAVRSTGSFAITGEFLEALGMVDGCREESRGVRFYMEDTRTR
jgi:hypothetical protein